jgi:NADH-quinone oxidoreductase subunit E
MSVKAQGSQAPAAVLSKHVLEEIRALPPKYPQPRSAVMPALDLAQEELGHLTPEAMSQVADVLQLDPGYVEGVATFYSLFHHEPIGKHRFYMCTNLACMLRGSEEVIARLKEAIGVSAPGEVSKDGMFSYEEVECLGACEYAPMCRIDRHYEYDLTVVKIDQVVNACRLPRRYQKQTAGETPAPKTVTKRAPRKKKADA